MRNGITEMKNFFRVKNYDKSLFRLGSEFLIVFLCIIAFVLTVSGCTVIDPKINPIKLECDYGECAVKPNLLICDKENIYCTYIDTPIITDDLMKYIA
jgi:hypothetical protein